MMHRIGEAIAFIAHRMSGLELQHSAHLPLLQRAVVGEFQLPREGPGPVRQ
jgi:hypothetical protein